MSSPTIFTRYQRCSEVSQIVEQLQQEKKHFQITNLRGSALSFVVAAIFNKTQKSQLLLFENREEATYYLNDLEQLLSADKVLFFPSTYKKIAADQNPDNDSVLLRSEVLNQINWQQKSLLVVTYPEALFEKVIPKEERNKNSLEIKVNETLSLDFLNEVLFEYDFNRVDFVTEPGEFSLRGGIIDVFSFSNEDPYRIEFSDDDVTSIRTFDIQTQLSKEKYSELLIIPNLDIKTTQENRESFLNYIAPQTHIFIKNFALLHERLTFLFEQVTEIFGKSSEQLFCEPTLIVNQLKHFTTAYLEETPAVQLSKIRFHTQVQPSFNQQFNLLIDNLNDHHTKGFDNFIFCANTKQAQRFKDIFEDTDKDIAYKTVVLPLYQGFIDFNNKLICYTDHQIFGRYHKSKLKAGYAKKQALTLKELTTLKVGDYVTHIDHGVGTFGGLQKIEVEGKTQEALKLIYAERDILYLSIHSLHKISRFNGKDGKPPRIYKLGSGAWKKIKQKTKKRVKEIAFDLIQLYANRQLQKGFAFAPDTHIQHELEASFLFEDTPDQFTATNAVKADMEKQQPMDRLICGDVGFGKTEVAIRAAFKAVDNSKQVAILVPTTILAFQHFRTFSQRLKNFPVRVDYLNRFRTPKEKKAVIAGLADGSIDIVIGTHQLTNKNIIFKDLGLLVIDEEQKFGVAIKDKLKTIKANVDTLTLTATPIPRTLQFSLMAARDLSVISTPPPNRYPIHTEVIRFSESTIRQAIEYEIARGGQVFFIHNRVANIGEIATLLQQLVPKATIKIGHGQLEGKVLETQMLNFIDGKFDVLVATTIVESGLDVPNANTIFINNAHNFGLADLHQMRGRVGRSNKKAFCYLITPPHHRMTQQARKRIEAISLFAALGSGLNLAMKDLEIRGAGDLLGGEQSGFISDMGFETYQKILQEAVEELKQNEFKTLYSKEEEVGKPFVKEVTLDTDFEILFPNAYVNSVSERLILYRKLATLQTEKQLDIFESEIVDRFGQYPKPVADLLISVRIKWLAKKVGFEKIVLKKRRMLGYFIADQQSPFYQSIMFTNLLQYVQSHPKSCVIKEKEVPDGLRLLITFLKADSLEKALNILKTVSGI